MRRVTRYEDPNDSDRRRAEAEAEEREEEAQEHEYSGVEHEGAAAEGFRDAEHQARDEEAHGDVDEDALFDFVRIYLAEDVAGVVKDDRLSSQYLHHVQHCHKPSVRVRDLLRRSGVAL
jgi:hypothetical protein